MYRLTAITLLVVVVSSVALASLDDWETFKAKHGKSYANPAEELRRRTIFEENVKRIEVHNANGEHSYKLGLNHMSDWTEDEQQSLNGFKMDKNVRLRNSIEGHQYLKALLESDKSELPETVDWREAEGVVTPVKDQHQCGSCWAFATTGLLEGQQKRKNITLTGLSEQNLVDCSEENSGCDGGLMYLALRFVRQEGGIDDAKSYPYRGREGKCAFKEKNSVMKVEGGFILGPGDEELLKAVVARYGPVSVAIAANANFQHYQGGVFNDPHCGDELNHGVLLVGYGTDPDHGDYWIVKNSWNAMWGEKGYVRMARNRNNQCGIADQATIAI